MILFYVDRVIRMAIIRKSPDDLAGLLKNSHSKSMVIEARWKLEKIPRARRGDKLNQTKVF
jgi:hypothetical protein